MLLNFILNIVSYKKYVAPRAGAWIETMLTIRPRARRYSVAPRTGAWIETLMHLIREMNRIKSPLAQGRGLKRIG